MRPTLRPASFLTALLFLLVPTLSTGESTPIALPSPDRVHVFLLAGQSNMAGRGAVEEIDRVAHPRVVTLNKELEWVPAGEPLHFDKPQVVGVGPGRAFGVALAEAFPDAVIALVPCAVGGSPIDSWQPGVLYPPTKSHPWDDAIRRAHHALRFGQLRGILWHQGESDAHPDLAPAYETKLHDLVRRLRETLDAPQVPFLAGQLGMFEERPWDAHRRLVDQAHRRLPDTIRNTAFVASDGLEHKGDRTHFSAAAARELGRRFAARYLELADEGSGTPISLRNLSLNIRRHIAHRGFDGETCWVHARAGVLPGSAGDPAAVVMTLQKLRIRGSDLFEPIHSMITRDLGISWTAPRPEAAFRTEKIGDGRARAVCDFWPASHEATGTLLGTGHTVVYENGRVAPVRPRATAYAVFNPAAGTWSPWSALELPDEPRFKNAGAGCAQRVDLPDGGILLPMYFKEPESRRYASTVARCRFDGNELNYERHGSELTIPSGRGLYEPSLAWHQGRFFLTLRADDEGCVATSHDGLTYDVPRPWIFDDGTPLGSANTQQHWVTLGDDLHLVYTRNNAGNDHVFRNRAPLFIARVDTDRLRVIRASEHVLVPERGARLGNFGVTQVSSREAWVTVTEWMQAPGPNATDPSIPARYGSDNRIWIVRITSDADID